MTALCKNTAKLEKRLSQRTKLIVDTGNEICDKLKGKFDIQDFVMNIFEEDLGGGTNAKTIVYGTDAGYEYQILFDTDYLLFGKPERIKITLAHEIAHCYTHEIYKDKLVSGYNKAKDKNKFMHDARWKKIFRETGYYVDYDCNTGSIK